jgi:CheY-like chemotaxis protein
VALNITQDVHEATISRGRNPAAHTSPTQLSLGQVFGQLASGFVHCHLQVSWIDFAAFAHISISADAARSAPLRILVVDDNEDAASSLAMLLQQIGHMVSVSHDGLEAVREAVRFAPEFVFLDIGLPRLNGYEVVKAIRQIDGLQDVPVVALTGWGVTHDIAHAAEAGFDSHLTKPASIEPILALSRAAQAARMRCRPLPSGHGGRMSKRVQHCT